MFSQIVTAAKGLFTRPESEEQLSTEPAGINTPTASKMVTATRQRVVEPEQPTEQPATNGVAKGGKRKAQGTNTEKTGQKQTKRRKQGGLEAAELTNGDSAGQTSKSDQHGSQTTESAPKNHFRFGSEEPDMPETSLPEPTPTVSKDEEDDSDSDSDDAPETIDNSAQLLKMKEQAKRQEKLKQVYVLIPPSGQCRTCQSC